MYANQMLSVPVAANGVSTDSTVDFSSGVDSAPHCGEAVH